MAAYPEIQTKVQQEIDTVVGMLNQVVGLNDTCICKSQHVSIQQNKLIVSREQTIFSVSYIWDISPTQAGP